jgi:ATP-dependent exoDNAse (exonuclease V) beta subunit
MIIEELKTKLYDIQNHIVFNDAKHTYHIDDKKHISVTTFKENFIPPFEEKKWLRIKSEARGITAEALKHEWSEKARLATTIGSIVHEYIENYIMQKSYTIPIINETIYTATPEEIQRMINERIDHFHIAYQKNLHKMSPLAMELQIFSKKWPLAGTIDALFFYKNVLVIGDWKTNKAFSSTVDESYNNLLWPFERFPNTHLHSYSLQVSLYRLILEEWGFKTGPGFLYWLGPDNNSKFHKTIDFRQTLRNYLNDYQWAA